MSVYIAMQKSKMSIDRYRPDIDGLRAVAILCVVIFHAFPALIPGGFIGVDIFFALLFFALLSFSANVLALNTATTTAFYMPYCRFWEMAVGGLVAAFAINFPQIFNKQTWNESVHFLAAAGMALVFLGLFLINKDRYFPGW
jgi:peptidoglycan/LPS O-acetylase OafA/YrhL